MAEEDEDEDEPVLETAGGVNWPLLSEPVLSRAGDDFFLGGLALALLPLCCCWRHLALRFLNHTCNREHQPGVRNQTHRQPQRFIKKKILPGHAGSTLWRKIGGY